MNLTRKQYISSCEISVLETAVLGGYPQKFAIEGKYSDLPVILCLHGGPGMPIPFSAGCRGLFPNLTDNAVMVYWDQLGCGINNRIIDNSFTIDSFVQMTADLVRYLKTRFPDNKLYLFGVSWGSILALRCALLTPELISGVVTNGQVLTPPMLSDNAFNAIKASSAPPKKKILARELRQRKTALSAKETAILSGIIRKYTNGYNNRNSKPAPIGSIIKGLLTSPDYRFRDFIATVNNGYSKNESLIKEMTSIDLRDALAKVSIPYHIFQGETDIVTGTKEVTAFVNTCSNPNITCTVIPDNGHLPSETAMNEIMDYILKTAK